MKKLLKLSKEQARTLYNLLSGYSVPDRAGNRKRFNFLAVLEDVVFEFDDKMDELRKKGATQVEIKKAASETNEFMFLDMNIWDFGKSTFEKSFQTGNKMRDPMTGRVTESPLTGRDAKVYMEIEDAFADVSEIKESQK